MSNLFPDIMGQGEWHREMGTAAQNFCTLFNVQTISVYTDGRIKARTARGAYVDLPRAKNYETDSWMFNAQCWVDIIREAERQLI